MKMRFFDTIKSEAGTTLAELMVAIVLLAIGILAVAQLFPAGTRGQVKSRMMTTANFYAQEKIERLGEQSWVETDLAVGAHPGGGPEALGASGAWARSWDIELMPPPLDNLKKITVHVTWNSDADTVQAVTYVRK